MGIFGTIGRALGGAAKGAIGGLLQGGPIGALTGGASGALGSLFAGGGLGGAIKGGLLGAAGGAIGQQAGLSWITVLKKRDHYRKCFKNFDPLKLARISDNTIEKLLTDTGLISNRLKLYSIKKNAVAFLQVQCW